MWNKSNGFQMINWVYQVIVIISFYIITISNTIMYHSRGGSRGGGAPPLKLEKKKKIGIKSWFFHTKYQKKISRLPQLGTIFLSAPLHFRVLSLDNNIGLWLLTSFLFLHISLCLHKRDIEGRHFHENNSVSSF